MSPPVPGTPETPPRSGRVDHQSLSRVVSPGRARAMSFPPLALFSSRSDVVSGAIPKLIPGSTGRGLPCPVLGTGAAPRDPKDLPAVSPPRAPAVPGAVSGCHLAPLGVPVPAPVPGSAPGSVALPPPPPGGHCRHPPCPTRGRGHSPCHTSAGTCPPPSGPSCPRPGPAPLPCPALLLGSTQAELPPQEPFPGDPSGLRDTGTRSGCPCHHARGDPGGPRLDPRAGWARGWAGPPRAPRGAAAARGGRGVPWGPGKAGKGTARRRRRPKAQRSSSGQCQHRDCGPSWGQRPPR